MTVYVFYRDVDKKDNKVAFIGKSHSHFDITGKDPEFNLFLASTKQRLLSSADNLCKQFRSRSGQTECGS